MALSLTSKEINQEVFEPIVGEIIEIMTDYIVRSQQAPLLSREKTPGRIPKYGLKVKVRMTMKHILGYANITNSK
jgi:hypothetical protein